ncbi:MAG: phosphoglucosamine mutase [Planctomycetia bacterium]|nr:phosphoglucosamine mutase [Planctomycetia bacterium]
MASPLIISVSGLRGQIGATLTPEVAARYALAYSQEESSKGPFVIANDGRRSGSIFADIINATLNASGRDTYDAGVAATPTVGVLIRSLGACGGIQISASHNPREYNGLKLFSAEGRVIPKCEGEKVLQRYQSLASSAFDSPWVDVEHIGSRKCIEDTTLAHMNATLATVDVELIRSKKFKVLLDSNNGSGSILGRRLLEALGCEVVICGEQANGEFLHTPEPTAENLQGVLAKVVDTCAVVGFCQDPDADRLALIDETGRYIGEEYTTALCCKNRLENARVQGALASENLVINCASSRMSIDIAEEFGCKCYRSPVGEANVVDLMKKQNAIFGGEGNGGPIDPRVGYVRDSFVGMAQVLEMMARNDRPLSTLADAIHGYSIVKRKVGLPTEGFQKIVDLLWNAFPNEEKNTEDGIRIDWPDAWALARPSNTEPIARIITEAPTNERAVAICDQIEAIMNGKR